jgi:purine-binding chemotaxis protein CheW
MFMETTDKHLIFRVKDQLFTIHVPHVSTIIKIPRLFQVPQAPNFILGVINLEGDVIPVIDTAIKLAMGKGDVHDKSQVIIMQRKLEGSEKIHLLGFLVSDVCDVVDIDSRKLQPLPTSKYDFDTRLVDGMHKIDEEFCMQINVDNFFKGEIEELIQQAASHITQ